LAAAFGAAFGAALAATLGATFLAAFFPTEKVMEGLEKAAAEPKRRAETASFMVVEGYFDENGESRKLQQRNGMLLLAHDAASRSPYEHAGIDIGLLADLSFSTSTNRVDLPKI
jgi:hypothetical protein